MRTVYSSETNQNFTWHEMKNFMLDDCSNISRKPSTFFFRSGGGMGSNNFTYFVILSILHCEPSPFLRFWHSVDPQEPWKMFRFFTKSRRHFRLAAFPIISGCSDSHHPYWTGLGPGCAAGEMSWTWPPYWIRFTTRSKAKLLMVFLHLNFKWSQN